MLGRQVFIHRRMKRTQLGDLWNWFTLKEDVGWKLLTVFLDLGCTFLRLSSCRQVPSRVVNGLSGTIQGRKVLSKIIRLGSQKEKKVFVASARSQELAMVSRACVPAALKHVMLSA